MDREQSLAACLCSSTDPECRNGQMALAGVPGVPEPVWNKAKGGVGKEGN